MPVSPYSTDNLHTGDGRKRQVDELFEYMSPVAVPFLKLVGIDGEPGHTPKLEWLERELLAETSKVADNPLSNSATTINVASGDGINFQAKMVIKIEDEYIYVTAVNGDTLTVVRGIAGTSAAQHANDTAIELVGFANHENASAPTSGTTDFTIPYNWFQDFDTSYQVSYKLANTEDYGVPEGSDEQLLAEKFKDVVIKLERSAIYGRRAAPDPNNNIPALMGGIDYFLSSAYSTRHVEINLGGADLEEHHINDVLEAIYYQVGEDNMARTIITSVWNKRRINDIYAPFHRSTRNERTGGVVVNTIDTDLGPVDVVHSLRVPKDTVYFVNLDFISVHPFRGLAFFDQELSRDGAYIKRQIYGSYTLKCKNTKAMGVIRGTSTGN